MQHHFIYISLFIYLTYIITIAIFSMNIEMNDVKNATENESMIMVQESQIIDSQIINLTESVIKSADAVESIESVELNAANVPTKFTEQNDSSTIKKYVDFTEFTKLPESFDPNNLIEPESDSHAVSEAESSSEESEESEEESEESDNLNNSNSNSNTKQVCMLPDENIHFRQSIINELDSEYNTKENKCETEPKTDNYNKYNKYYKYYKWVGIPVVTGIICGITLIVLKSKQIF